MRFSRQGYWSGLSGPPPGDVTDPGVKPAPPVSPALARGFLTADPLGKPQTYCSSISLSTITSLWNPTSMLSFKFSYSVVFDWLSDLFLLTLSRVTPGTLFFFFLSFYFLFFSTCPIVLHFCMVPFFKMCVFFLANAHSQTHLSNDIDCTFGSVPSPRWESHTS